MCPHCRQNAPLVYRGVIPYCTACGVLRMPLSSAGINTAGKPSKVGGAVARAFGWVVLLGGSALSLLFGLLCYAIFTGKVGLAVGLPLELLSVVASLLLFRGGNRLAKSGAMAERSTRVQAIYGLAGHRGGVLTAPEVARAIGVDDDEADALLTQLAKTKPDQVTVDLDDAGVISYRFPNAGGLPRNAWPQQNVRVETSAPRSRVSARGDVREIEVELEEEVRAARGR
jgi:hypothetical protein